MAEKGKRELESVSFRKADNGGLICEAHCKTHRGGQGGGPSYDYETETTIHPTVKDAQGYLAEAFGGESEEEKS